MIVDIVTEIDFRFNRDQLQIMAESRIARVDRQEINARLDTDKEPKGRETNAVISLHK